MKIVASYQGSPLSVREQEIAQFAFVDGFKVARLYPEMTDTQAYARAERNYADLNYPVRLDATLPPSELRIVDSRSGRILGRIVGLQDGGIEKLREIL
jgi:hypothetical protein